ncbi:MAG TPA: LysR family transcriptional regulator, partial [Ramlibacter sp.]|nr:LysR family transcriptional regulator [Ramlibacter sp.]
MPHDITDLRFFVTITECGSLAEAARRLDVTPSAVSQRLRQLESRLGLQLAHRSTRRFALTEEGELFHAGVAALLVDLDRLVDSLRERSGEVAGT